MFRYRNEAEFSAAVVRHLRKYGWFVQRIETGTTGRGVPDIYAISPDKQAMWLELKRVHCCAKGRSVLKIPWRPGQQAWLREVTARGQRCFTLACCDDFILQISHKQIWSNDCVELSKCGRIARINDL